MVHLTRRRFLAGAGVTAATLSLSGYATAYETGSALTLAKYAPRLPNWPEDLELTIAVIADIHACYPWMSEERVGDIVDLANGQKPDLTVLLGDYVCTHRFVSGYAPPGAWAEQWLVSRRRLASTRFGQSRLVVGGHSDRAAGQFSERPPSAGRGGRSAPRKSIGAVVPARTTLLADGLGDLLAPIPNPRRGHGADDLPGAMRVIGDDAPAILLVHEPYFFPWVPDRIALTLAGHMHGGQVNLPIIGPPVGLLKRRSSKYIYGEYVLGEKRMIVSGGLGTSLAPVRILRPPEVVMVKLGGDGWLA